ncbi:MAG: hypothetical protein RL693_1843, partial [Verrucomicrobiota bacterium]
AASGNIRDNRKGQLRIKCRIAQLRERKHIVEMVRDAGLALCGWLGSANVETAIELIGIGIDDFTPYFFRKRDGECGLAGASRTYEIERRWNA